MLSFGKVNVMPNLYRHSFEMWKSVSPYLKCIKDFSYHKFHLTYYKCDLLVSVPTPHEVPETQSAFQE